MKLTNHSAVPVYTISGASTARPLPEWLVRKRKRSLKQDPEFANRIELLQDFEFEEASQCVRISEDGDWLMSTGTYKPQIHTHYLPHLSLSYARHTNTINQTFVLLSSDYSKSLHLQTDRWLEFHTPGGVHYTARIPRYGRDLVYSKRSAEALIPAVGVNADGNGEVFRLNLEIGRFMKGYDVDVGGDDFESLGGGALQGGINTGAVNTAAVAEGSHNLLAFGTSLGTVEFWDSRSRSRVSVLPPATSLASSEHNGVESRPEITALSFHRSGLQLATGSSNGLIHTYDLRSPVPLVRKDQGYGYPIQNLSYLLQSSRNLGSEKILSADKRIIKIWDASNGDPWTSVEPAVDLNHVEIVPDSGMLLTANEGRQQHSFFIPQLGPAPKWCAFLDNLVEELAEDAADPNAYGAANGGAGEVYDNYKFLDSKQLVELNLEHLVGTTSLLRPYMHGYFVAQKLYEQARLISNPEIFEQQRSKSIQEKIDKERESRIRGNKKASVKVNRRLAEKMAEREEANERRKAKRVLAQGGDKPAANPTTARDKMGDKNGEEEAVVPDKPPRGVLGDDRFTRLFQDEDFEIDETSREFALHNPSSVPNAPNGGKERKRGLTAAEQEELEDRHGSSDDNDDADDSNKEEEDGAAALLARRNARRQNDDERVDRQRIGSSSYTKAGHKSQQRRPPEPKMHAYSLTRKTKPLRNQKSQSFGDLASSLPSGKRASGAGAVKAAVVGEKEITFAPAKKGKVRGSYDENDAVHGRKTSRGKDRRSASGNVFRQM